MESDTKTQTYEDVQKLIYKMCHLFRRRHGGEFEELVAEANVAFCKAYEHWRANGGACFSTYLATAIYRRLLDKKRTARRRAHVWKEGQWYDFQVPAPAGGWQRLSALVEGLSEDAKTIVQLVLDTPAELLSEVKSRGGKSCNWRTSILDHLADDAGWKQNRVSRAFQEVRAALAE